MLLDLTSAEWELIREALDSHLYWQLSDEDRRDSGYVREPYTEEEQECVDLETKIQIALNAPRPKGT